MPGTPSLAMITKSSEGHPELAQPRHNGGREGAALGPAPVPPAIIPRFLATRASGGAFLLGWMLNFPERLSEEMRERTKSIQRRKKTNAESKTQPRPAQQLLWNPILERGCWASPDNEALAGQPGQDCLSHMMSNSESLAASCRGSLPGEGDRHGARCDSTSPVAQSSAQAA